LFFLGDYLVSRTFHWPVALLFEGAIPWVGTTYRILPEIPFVRVSKESGCLMTLKASYVCVPHKGSYACVCEWLSLSGVSKGILAIL